jgi:hypothetical protein
MTFRTTLLFVIALFGFVSLYLLFNRTECEPIVINTKTIVIQKENKTNEIYNVQNTTTSTPTKCFEMKCSLNRRNCDHIYVDFIKIGKVGGNSSHKVALSHVTDQGGENGLIMH